MVEQAQEKKKPYWNDEWGPNYKSPYEMWKAQEGVPTLRGWIVRDLPNIELTPWPSRGGSGVFMNLEGTEGFNDSYVYEIPLGKSSNPIRHIFENAVYVLKGHGATTVWYDEKRKHTFEWRERSYFGLPPNAWYQHHNGSGTEPARFVGFTAAPRVINTFKDLDFVFNNPYQFRDRFNNEEGYFQDKSTSPWKHNLYTNFVADVLGLIPKVDDKPTARNRQSVSGGAVRFHLVNGTMNSHAKGWKVGMHLGAHRHGPGIHIIILTSRGYSLMWPDGGTRVRVDYGPGDIFVPPERWWHQHFNTGPEPLYHLAAGWGSEKPKIGGGAYYYWTPTGHGDEVRGGEDVILHEQEDPEIHRKFEEDLKRDGIQCNMQHHPHCTYK